MTDAAEPLLQAPPAKPPGPRLSISLIVIVVGVVLAVIGGVQGITKIVHSVTSPVEVTPADIHRHLSTGTYEIYVSESFFASLSPSQVSVMSDAGQPVPVSGPGSTTETLTRGSTSYRGQLTFTIHQAGDYDVRVGGPSGVPFVLSNSLGDLVKRVLPWFALLGLGVLMAIVGVVLAIVGAVGRSRARRRPQTPGYQVPRYQPAGYPPASYQPYSGQPPPGWYTDPSLPGLRRWWDGTRWTDQTNSS
jgi:hypothetical protein